MIYKGKKHEGQKKTEFTLPAKMIWKSCLYFSWVQLKGVFRPAFFFNLLLWIHVVFCHICCSYLLYSLNSQMWVNGSTEKVNVLSPPEKQRQNLLRVSHSGPGTTCSSSLISGSPVRGLLYFGISQITCVVLSGLLGLLFWVGLFVEFFWGGKGIAECFGVFLWFGLGFFICFFVFLASIVRDWWWITQPLLLDICVWIKWLYHIFTVVISSTRFKQ